MLEFLKNNWYCIAVVIILITSIILEYKKGKSIVMKMVYPLVTEAEKSYGAGTGSLKLAAVLTLIYPKLPAAVKLIVSEKTLLSWIEIGLSAAKEIWAKNKDIENYISNGSNNIAGTTQNPITNNEAGNA